MDREQTVISEGIASETKDKEDAQRQVLEAALTDKNCLGTLRRCALARIGHFVHSPQERAYLVDELLSITALEVLRCAHRFTLGHDPLPWIKAFIRRLSLRLADQFIRDRNRWVSFESLREDEDGNAGEWEAGTRSGTAAHLLPQYLRRYDAVEDTVLDALEGHQLLDAVSVLDKKILSAYYLWGDSYNDIACELNLKPETVRQRACRAIRRLEAARERSNRDMRDALIPLHKPVRLQAT